MKNDKMEYSKSDQKWEFRPGGQTESPQNSAIKDFSKHIFESIVREAIQNSLDNPDTTTNEPVIIKFEFGNIRSKDVLGYNDLIKHYKATKKFWHKDKNYKSIFDSIDNRLQDFKEKLPFLKISDFNTIGMHLESEYGKNKRLSNYYAFTRGNNTVKASTQAGGSEGQGKATFYAASAIRTLFLHTVSEHGSIFEGLTRLATHSINNIDYSANGHLLQDIDNPTPVQNKIQS